MWRQVITIAVACAAVTITACGTDEAAERRAEQAKQAEARKAKQARERRQAEAKAAACETRFEPFIRELSDIDSRLDIGLSYDEYSDQLGDAKFEYDQISDRDSDADILSCLTSVGLPLENALNKYAEAGRVWSRCLEDIDCSTDSIDSRLQARWRSAGRHLDRAKDGLSDLKTATG